MRKQPLLAVLLLLFISSGRLLAVNPTTIQKYITDLRHADHEIWYLTTRQLPQYENLEQSVGDIGYYKMEGKAWNKKDAAEFNSAEDLDTMIVVHGSPATVSLVSEVCLDVYWHIQKVIPESKTRMRFVIWSWPADRQVTGLVKEFRDQARRAQPQGYYLGHVIDQCRAKNDTVLVGYSMGARVASCALHLLAGGKSEFAPTLKPISNKKVSYLVVAGAINRDWLEPGQHFGEALKSTNRFLNVYNSTDPLLKRYPKLYPKGKSRPEATGYKGLYSHANLDDFGIQIDEINVSAAAGKSHDIRYITRDIETLKKIWSRLLMPVFDDN
ncbi:MAG: hypothetical protein CMJ76_01530 [Planctomycetaceae bacterium]|nr:hypothetical protein [Planctomycetaceae bacterium]